MNQWFFRIFGIHIFKVTASLICMPWNFACKPCGRRSRAACVEPCHWSEGRLNNVGVSLREMRATMQVMQGVSLQARLDAILVFIKQWCLKHGFRSRDHYKYHGTGVILIAWEKQPVTKVGRKRFTGSPLMNAGMLSRKMSEKLRRQSQQ